MKKIKLTHWAFITLLSASVVFVACKKTSDVQQGNDMEVQETIASSQADAVADVLYNDVFDNVISANEEVGIGGGAGVFGRAINTQARELEADTTPRCLTVIVSAGAFPKTVTLDFGTGCTDRYGRTRRGKIITVYTGRMGVPGSKATTTFDGFYSDSIKVEGTHIIQNNSVSNNRIFSVGVENGKLSMPGGNYIAWNKNRTRTQVEGNGTPNYLKDDVFNITGTANGTVKIGANTIQWSAEIVQPVTRNFTCRWAVKGQTTITRNNKTGLLDYGNGSCDDQATLTINGNIHSITLR